jgi:hypothetical protein
MKKRDRFQKTKAWTRKGHTPWNDHDRASDDGMPLPTDNSTADPPFKLLGIEDDDVWSPWPEMTDREAAEYVGVAPPRTRSDIIKDMKEQRNAPKIAQAPPPFPYSETTIDASKLRECLSECSKVIADGLVKAAKIIAKVEDEIAKSANDALPGDGWTPVGPGTPVGVWLETKHSAENGTNICMCRIGSIGEDPEWSEWDCGRTTVTHSTFLAPTHWRWPRKG